MGNEETNRNVPNMNKKSSRVDVEVGNSSTENDDDINDAQVTDYKQLIYKLFRYRTYKLRSSNGEFGCLFCDNYKEEHECHYTHLLLHAIRVAESEENRKHKASHLAMARFLAIDLAEEVKAEADRLSQSEDSTKRETDGVDKVNELERKMNEMTEQMNALITKERATNDELKRARRELIKGLSDMQCGDLVHIGIKGDGDDDDKELTMRVLCGNIVIIGAQERFKHPQSYIIDDDDDDAGGGDGDGDGDGEPRDQRIVKEDELALQSVEEERGGDIHDAVVEALAQLEVDPSGCYNMVPELWNFIEKRKATLDEVIRVVFQLPPLRPKPSNQPPNS